LLNTPPKPPTTPLPALLLHQRKHVVKSELLVASGFPGGPRGGGGQSVSSSSRRGTPRASGGGATCSLLRRGSGGRCPTALLVQPQFARKEKARFYRMARRSATECAAILDVVNELELPPDRNSARGANTCRPSLPCSGNSLPQALSPRELDSSPPLICNLQCYALTKPPRSGLDHMERPAHDRKRRGHRQRHNDATLDGRSRGRRLWRRRRSSTRSGVVCLHGHRQLVVGHRRPRERRLGDEAGAAVGGHPLRRRAIPRGRRGPGRHLDDRAADEEVGRRTSRSTPEGGPTSSARMAPRSPPVRPQGRGRYRNRRRVRFAACSRGSR
jgi:hypothetical protein